MKKQAIKHQADQNTYQTGSTNPPKSHQGTVAVLLILLIFLGGIVSILSMMNIRLFQMLEQQENSSVQFSQLHQTQDSVDPESLPEGFYAPSLGFTGQEVTNLYRSYQDWPQGVYISEVAPNSPAAKADLRPGDILLTIDGVTVDNEKTLEELISKVASGQTLTFQIFRDQQELTVTVTAD